MFYFFIEDFNKLCIQIEEIIKKIKDFGKEIGQSCNESSETYHDNFAYENSERQMQLLSTRLREIIEIKNKAKIIKRGTNTGKVTLGRIVTFIDDDTEETKTLMIGSYMVLDENCEKVISYNSPLAKILMGGSEGELREGVIAGKDKRFKIIKIE